MGFFSDLLDRSDNDSYLEMGLWKRYNPVDFGGCWFTRLPGAGERGTEIGQAKNTTGPYGQFMFSLFKETADLFSKVAVPFHIPANNALPILPNMCYCLLYYRHSDGCEVVSFSFFFF